METLRLTSMSDQKADRSLFEHVPLNITMKITSFDNINWTDPADPKLAKPIKFLKTLTHNNYIYPQESFDKEKPP
jgi:hypothetical protein